jgi:hypothetical protein
MNAPQYYVIRTLPVLFIYLVTWHKYDNNILLHINVTWTYCVVYASLSPLTCSSLGTSNLTHSEMGLNSVPITKWY